jgi:hypothetical protein
VKKCSESRVKCGEAAHRSLQTSLRGCGRTGNGEFHRFLNTAAGSAMELEYFLLLSRDLNFLSDERYENLSEHVREVQRMLASLIRKVDVARRTKASC